MTNTPLRSIAFLVKNGLRIDEIERLDEAEIVAFSVAFGELSGGEWDWRAMRWLERDSGS